MNFQFSRIFRLFVIVFLLFSSSEYCFSIRAIPDDLIVHPVLITLNNESKTTGSGFYYSVDSDAIYLISAYHVFVQKDKAKNYSLLGETASVLSYSKDLDWQKPTKIELNISLLSKTGLLKFDSNSDVVAIQIARINSNNEKIMSMNSGVTWVSKSGILIVPQKNTKSYKDVLIGNDVYISGFPSSLGIKRMDQIDYDRPLLRKGIVAGKNDKHFTIIIDCPTYGGNSGGPVIELETVSPARYNVRVIGIISQFVPFVERWFNPQYKLANIEFENSGYTVVVPMDRIQEVVEKFYDH